MASSDATIDHALTKPLPQFPTGLRQYHHYLKPDISLPKPPEVLDLYKKIDRWPLDGNAKYGDCTLAAAAHAIHLWNVATRQSDPIPLTAEVVAEYDRLAKGSQEGLIEADVLKKWHDSGLWGNKILGYAPVNVHNIALIKQAAYLYGLVYAGVQITKSAGDQFKQRKPWSLVPGWQSEVPIGGHAVPIVGYDEHYFYVVTWGIVQPVTFEWWHTYGEEAWAILPAQLKQAGGCDHLSLEQLHADLKAIWSHNNIDNPERVCLM